MNGIDGATSECRPRRMLDWREDDRGRCVVLRPKLGRGPIGRWLAARLRDPYYRIRLDEIGTAVWKACDGETPLATIADGLRRQFGERIEPADARLGRFVRQLVRARLVAVDLPPSPGRAEPAAPGGSAAA